MMYKSILILTLCLLAINALDDDVTFDSDNISDDVMFDSGNMDSKTVSIYQALFPAFQSKENIESYFTGLIQLSELQRQLLGVRDHPLRESPRKHFRSFFRRKSRPMQAPYLFQGDLLLTKDQMNVIINSAKQQVAEKAGIKVDEREKRALIPQLDRRWRQFPIPYTVDRDVDLKVIQAGLAQWSDNTCISFEYKPIILTGLKFVRSDGCFSSLGRTGGVQIISIGDGCGYPGIVAHEVGHALGLHHEQARFDRDDFIKVLFENVDDGMYSAFMRYKPTDMITHGVGYDYGSIMHYEAKAFSRGIFSAPPTISTLDPNFIDTIGQREVISFKDVKKINFAYCNATCTSYINCQNGGYPDPKNCSTCRCPEGFGDKLCDKLIRSDEVCGKPILYARHIESTLTQSGNGTCYYVIKAPRGWKIKLSIDTVKFNSFGACETEYVELRYGTDLGSTGARLCNGNVPKKDLISGTNKVMVIYKGQRRNRNVQITFSIAERNH